jgi:hypothetical protein
VAAHAAVGVHNDLAPGQTGVAHWPADDEAAGGVDIDFHLVIDHVRRQDGQDHMLDNRLANLFLADIWCMLGADQDRMNTLGFAVSCIPPSPVICRPGAARAVCRSCALPTGAGELVRQVNGHGHEHSRLGAGIPEHHALVTGADRLDLRVGHFAGFGFQRLIDAHGDIARLAGNR